MSYTFAIVMPPIEDSDVEAWKKLEKVTAEEGSAPADFRLLYERLVEKYPCLSALPEEEIDEGVWSDGPLWNNFKRRAAVLGIVFSAVEEVLPFVVEQARSAGMAVFDWQTELIHRPDGAVDLRLDVEDKETLLAPTLTQVLTEVERLTPEGGPGCLCVERSNQDYVQAAGGDGEFTVEWREYAEESFRHWVAGYPGQRSTKEIAIQTNGFQVTVMENERLTAADVKAIVSAFFTGDPRPSAFSWRDVISRFD